MYNKQNQIVATNYDTFTNDKGNVIYRCRLTLYDSITHKTETKIVTARSRDLLDARVDIWINDGDDDVSVLRSMKSPSVGRCVVVWLECAKNKVSKETLYRYKISARNYIIPKFGNLRIKKITPQILQDYFDKLSKDRSPRTLQMLRSHFSTFFDTVVQMGVIEKNPVKVTDSPIGSSKKVLTKEEITKLLTVAKSGKYLCQQSDADFEEFLRRRNYLIVLLGSVTGLSKEEIIGMKWSYVQKNKIILASSMNRLRWAAEIPKDVIREINEWRKFQNSFAKKDRRNPYRNMENLMFTSLSGKRITAHWFNRLVFKEMCVAAGLSTKTQFGYLCAKEV